MRRLAIAAVALAVLGVSARASAAPRDCTKVERAKRRGGRIATLLAVARCHHDAGQYKAAWYEYTEAAARAREKNDKAALKAAQRGERENAGLLAWITVTVADRETELSIDGEKTVSGAKKAVDPGKHTIKASGPHRPPFSKELSLQSGDVEEVTVPAAEADLTDAAPPPSPAASNVDASAGARPAATSPSLSAPADADRAPDAAPSAPKDDEAPHVGLAADLDANIQLYDEVPVGQTDRQSGQAFLFVAQVAYDVTPELRAFVRYGLIDNYAPGRSHAASVSNPVLGGSYGTSPMRLLRLAAEAGLVLPLGSGGGDDPAAGIAGANVRGRALYPTMFDPNYLTPYVGASAATIRTPVVGRLELGFDPSIKTSGGDAFDGMKTRLRVTAHAGYRVVAQVEPFVEMRWFRFLSTPKFVEVDGALADNLFAGAGVAAAFGPLRAQVIYLRAFDAPLVRDDFSVFAFRLGADF